MKKNLIHLAFISYIILDLAYLREALFEYTFPITKYLQSNYGTPGFIAFNRFVAILLLPDLCAVMNILFFCICSNKYRALKATLFQCLSLYVLLFYKTLMNDPRPYFVDSEIKGWECYGDFGNPSGHATSVWMFYGIIMVEIYREICDKYRKRQFLLKVVRAAFVGVFVFLVISIIFCRIFLGVHSLNQVMMGSVFGIYIFTQYLLNDLHVIEKILDFLRNQKYSSYLKLLVFGLSLLLLVQVPVEIYKFLEKEVPQQWADNVKAKCPHLDESNKFYKVCFKACATIGIAFGPMFALILNKKSHQLVLFEFTQKNYSENNKVLSFKNIGKALLGTSIFIFAFIFCYKLYPVRKFLPNISSIYDKYYSMMLGSFFSTFFLTLAFPYLYSKKIVKHQVNESTPTPTQAPTTSKPTLAEKKAIKKEKKNK